jgi:hypothetical protein
MYVKRNPDGEIIALSKTQEGYFREYLSDDDPAIISFIQGGKYHQQLLLAQTDQTMARVLEDVINLLVEQGLIRFTDLPDAAQAKLLNRRELRGLGQAIDLLDEGDDLHL